MTSLSAQTAQGRPELPGGTRIVLITGSTDGLGREVAMRVAATGAHVIVHGRNSERGKAVVDEIARSGRGSARFYAADFAAMENVRKFAAAITADYDRLHVLVNNAGIWLPNSRERVLSPDGYEMHFAVNYLAGHLLTRELLPLLEAGAPSRVINVSSLAQSPIDFDDVMMTRGYSGSRAYGQSKLAQVLFTFDVAASLQTRRIAVNALHPATMMNTSMVAQSGMSARSTVDAGARALMQLIVDDVGTGKFFNGMSEARAQAQAYDAAARARLRTLADSLVK